MTYIQRDTRPIDPYLLKEGPIERVVDHPHVEPRIYEYLNILEGQYEQDENRRGRTIIQDAKGEIDFLIGVLNDKIDPETRKERFKRYREEFPSGNSKYRFYDADGKTIDLKALYPDKTDPPNMLCQIYEEEIKYNQTDTNLWREDPLGECIKISMQQKRAAKAENRYEEEAYFKEQAHMLYAVKAIIDNLVADISLLIAKESRAQSNPQTPHLFL